MVYIGAGTTFLQEGAGVGVQNKQQHEKGCAGKCRFLPRTWGTGFSRHGQNQRAESGLVVSFVEFSICRN